MDPYSTHLPLLREIFKYKQDIKTVIEFGMGHWSTKFLLSEAQEKVSSIEMQKEHWYNNLVNELGNNPKWKSALHLGPSDFLNFPFEERYDFAFVDGHGDSRPEAINFISNRCDTIATHDTETDYYGWERVNLGPDFHSFEDMRYHPRSKVWSKDLGLIEHLRRTLV